jgi:linoleoyl-CoA desaturase
MYLKSVFLGAAFVTSYLLLVFAANNLWQGLLFAVLLAVTTAAFGFNIPHDSSHNGYSASPLVNKIMVRTLDLIGGAPTSGIFNTSSSITGTSISRVTTWMPTSVFSGA